MPIVSIDAPGGLSIPEKKRMMRDINAALTEAFGISDNIIFLREYARENVAIAGVLRLDAAGENRAKPRPGRAPHAST